MMRDEECSPGKQTTYTISSGFIYIYIYVPLLEKKTKRMIRMITGTCEPSFQTRGPRHLPWCIVRICYIQQYQRKTLLDPSRKTLKISSGHLAYSQQNPIQYSKVSTDFPQPKDCFSRYVRLTKGHTSLSPFSRFETCWLEKVALPRG